MAQTDLYFTFEPACNRSDDPLEHVALDVVEFKLTEALNEPFVLEVELLSTDASIDFGKLLDQGAVLTVWQGSTPLRHVHGIISNFSQRDTGFRRTRYHALVEPVMARTQLYSDWRIFQQKTVPEIISQVLKADHVDHVNLNAQQPHLQREYCVQADETDFSFIQRLLAEESFVYRFEHSEQTHQLLVTDVIQTFGAFSTAGSTDAEQDHALSVSPVLYQPNPAGEAPQPALRTFTYQEQVRTARQTQRDYTFKHPSYDQQQMSLGRDMPAQSTEYERYDYPGRYKQDSAGVPFTRTRLQSLRRDAKIATASGDDARIQPGIAFELSGHPRNDLNTYWRAVRIEHSGQQHTSSEEEAAGAQVSTRYTQTAELVPATTEWKAPIPQAPVIKGPLIACITGPDGEEIYTDEWGRVKVQFPWDRDGNHNEHSSCWIRVAQGWGIGGGDGQQSIPHIGQEVVVDFLNGDVDQPLITGRTNNAHNPVPYELPRYKTRSTWRSRTHKGKGFNEIRFEDECDQEEIYIHAQKDRNIEVLHDETTWVGHDRREHVANDEHIVIGNDRTEKVSHNENVDIGNDRHHYIAQDDILLVDRQRKVVIGHNHEEEVHGSRHEIIHQNNLQENKGFFEHQVEDYHSLSAGNKIIRKTVDYVIEAQERIILKAPEVAIQTGNMNVTGNFNLRGLMNATGPAQPDEVSSPGAAARDSACVSCWLLAAAEHSAFMALA